MSTSIGPRRRDDIEIEARVSTWTSTVFEVRRDDRAVFVNVPEDDLEAFLGSLEAGTYDATLRAALDSPPDVVLDRLEQTDTIAIYGRLGDPANLVPVERDPRTGKPLDAKRARRNKRRDHQQVRTPNARPKALVAAAVVVGVLAVAGIGVAATSGGSGKSKASVAGAQPGSGKTGPGGAAGTPATAGFTNAPAIFKGFTTIRSQVLQPPGDGYTDDGLGPRSIELDCSKAGCAMEIGSWHHDGGLELTARTPAKGWSLKKTVTNPNSVFYQCLPAVPGVWTFDLHGSGITQQFGIDMPARMTGTVTRKSPQTRNCPGIDAAYSLSAPLFKQSQTGGDGIVYG
jgi:hypothetical protein